MAAVWVWLSWQRHWSHQQS